jgi:rubrerythrin
MANVVGPIETTEFHYPENNHKKQMHFLICESCFWRASTPNLHFIEDETIPKCPLCDGNRIGVIPISRGLQL